MTTLNETLTDAAGNALVGVVVNVTVAGSGGTPLPAAYGADDTLVSRATATTDADGAWSVDVPANSTLTPSGTVYRITMSGEGVDPTPRFVTVPGSGPVDVGDILTEAPGAIESSALASHVAATTDVHGIADTSILETTTGAQAKADAAQSAAIAASQPVDVDLTAIAELSTTEYGRSLLESVDEDTLAAALADNTAARAIHDGRYGPAEQDQVVDTYGAESYTKLGLVLEKSSSAGFDAYLVESPCVYFDHEVGRLRMLYVGYDVSGGSSVGSIGSALSDNGIDWEKDGQFFTASGDVGAPDRYGVSGPVMVVDAENGVEHLFYIGLTALGYEGGTKSLCHASRPFGGSWTRNGAIISPSGNGDWYDTHVYHANLVRVGTTWYLFFNAEDDASIERVGYATASSLDGPWTVNPTPLFTDPPARSGYDIKQGDPFVWRWGGVWRMDFFTADISGVDAYDLFATTADDDFPTGWVEQGPTIEPSASGFDSQYAHKPWICKIGGRVFHYYTATDGTNRGIALAVSGDVQYATMQHVRPEATAASTSSTTYVTVSNSTGFFDTTDKIKPQVRLIARANPAGGTLTVKVNDTAGAIVDTPADTEVDVTGATWTDAVGPWVDVTSTGVTRFYAQMKASTATSMSLGNLVFEFRWLVL